MNKDNDNLNRVMSRSIPKEQIFCAKACTSYSNVSI